MRSKGSSLTVASAIVTLLVCAAPASGQDPPDPVPRPEDREFLGDFGEALGRFRAMSLAEFLEDYGPTKRYATGPSSAFTRGDANGDGAVNIADAICALAFLFLGGGPCSSPSCLDAFDVDDSGRVVITDAIYLLDHLFRGGGPPPGPYPDRGEDTTDDALGCAGPSSLDHDPRDAEFLDIIRNVHPLSARQEEAFARDGFVILEDHTWPTFTEALREIWADHLPLYVSVDALLDALHLSFDRMLMEIEEEVLFDALEEMLGKLEVGIESLEEPSPTAWLDRALHDARVWTCTARSLLAGRKVDCPGTVDTEVEAFLAHVEAAVIRQVSIFGESVEEDFSQFTPRGHYTKSERLRRYFRAMMWVQRIGMDFTQSPRHAAVAFALARALETSGATREWERVNGVVSTFVGVSDSLDPPGFNALAVESGIDSVNDLYLNFEAFARLALERGAGAQRINSQILAFNPISSDGFTPIPPAFHVMGQRFIVDSFVFTNVIFDRVQSDRFMPSPLDAWFVLGNPATIPLLRNELERHRYHPNLAALDWLVRSYPEEFWRESLYNLWLSALRELDADTTGDRYPPVMRTVAWDRRMLHAQLASWAHLRHDTILYAKQSFTPALCEYPDGWVDPYPEFYERLADFAAGARSRFEALGLSSAGRGRYEWYFESLARSASMLASIARAELEGVELTGDQSEFLRSTLSTWPNCDGPIYDGWYPDIVFDFSPRTSTDFEPTIADVHTNPPPNPGSGILHVGVGLPSLCLISVKNECGLKAYVGPALSYHEFVSSDMRRWNDEEWEELLASGPAPRPSWATFVR